VIPDTLVSFFAANQELLWLTTLGLGFAKYIFKLVIALIDTAFIYWAKQSFIRHHPAEA
jgi:uncharacterized PurR-regulated membrane protein YhhQ (DUF165 family)